MAKAKETFGIVTVIRYALDKAGKLVSAPASELLVYPSTESAYKSTMYFAGQMRTQKNVNIDIDRIGNVVSATKTMKDGGAEVTVWNISECEHVTTKTEWNFVENPDTDILKFMNDQYDAYKEERIQHVMDEIGRGRSAYDVWMSGNFTHKEVDTALRKLENEKKKR